MNSSRYRFRLFVSHSFREEHHPLGLSTFRATVAEAASTASHSVSAASHGTAIEIEPYFEDNGSGLMLAGQIRGALSESDIVLVDTSGLSPNVFYELGFGHALSKRLVVVQCRDITPEVPRDVSDLIVGGYTSVIDLKQHLSERFRVILAEALIGLRRGTIDPGQRSSWFRSTVENIHIVCAPEPEMSRFAAPDAENYLFVDSLEDRDSLMELAMALSRAHPRAKILRHSSATATPDVLESNLVVLGGPLNNHVARDFLRLLDIDLIYDAMQEAVRLTGSGTEHTLHLRRTEENLIVRDVGYYGRFENPFARGNRVILCQGYYTFGTLGATMILSDSSQGLLNRDALLHRLGARRLDDLESLQLLFPVDVLTNRKVVVPKVEQAIIVPD